MFHRYTIKKNDLDSLHINLINLCSDRMICDDNYNYIDVIKLIYLINSFKAYFDTSIYFRRTPSLLVSGTNIIVINSLSVVTDSSPSGSLPRYSEKRRSQSRLKKDPKIHTNTN